MKMPEHNILRLIITNNTTIPYTWLYRYVEKLESKERAVMNYYFCLGNKRHMTIQEMSEIYGISKGAMRKIVKSAEKNFMALIEKDWDLSKITYFERREDDE